MSRPCIGHSGKSVLALVKDSNPSGFAFYSFDPSTLQNSINKATSVSSRQISAQPSDGFVYQGLCSFDEATGYFALYGTSNQRDYVIRELSINDSDQVTVVSNVSVTHTSQFSSFTRINVPTNSSSSCYASWQLGWPTDAQSGDSGNIVVYCSTNVSSTLTVTDQNDVRTKNAWLIPYTDDSLIMMSYPSVASAYAYNTTTLQSSAIASLQLPFSPSSDALVVPCPERDCLLYVSVSAGQIVQFSAGSTLAITVAPAPTLVPSTTNATNNTFSNSDAKVVAMPSSKKRAIKKTLPYRRITKRQISVPPSPSNNGNDAIRSAKLPTDVDNWNSNSSVVLLNPTLPGLRSTSSGGPVALFMLYNGNGAFTQYNQDASGIFQGAPISNDPNNPLQPNQSNSQTNNSSSNLGAIIGGVIGGVVGLALLLGLLVMYLRRLRKSKQRLNSVDQQFLTEKERALDMAAGADDAYISLPLNEEKPHLRSFAGNPNIKLLSYPEGSQELIDLNPDTPGERRILQSEYFLENTLPVFLPYSMARFCMFQPINKSTDATSGYMEPGDSRRMIHYYREQNEDAFVRAVEAAAAIHSERVIHHYTAYALENPTPSYGGYRFMWISSPYHVSRTLQATLFETKDRAVLDDEAFKEYATASLIHSVRDIHRAQIAHMALSPSVYYCEKASAVLKWQLAGFEQSALFGSVIKKPQLSTYSAPELWQAQANTCKADAAADIWSLGCIIYSIASGGKQLIPEGGLPPTDWEDTVQLALKDLRVSQPVFCDSLLQDMLNIHPEYRPTAEELSSRWSACHEDDDEDEDDDDDEE